MARTKQSARRSTGGKAPRQLLSVKSANGFKSYMTSHQASGTKVFNHKTNSWQSKKISYLNTENLFYSYHFAGANAAQVKGKEFMPHYATARTVNPFNGEQEDWLSVTFQSQFDGNGIRDCHRPGLNLVIVLDVSGSMSSGLGDGGYHESRLSVATDCLLALLDKLRDGDALGIVLFNHGAWTELPLTPFHLIDLEHVRERIGNFQASGSTSLSAGYKMGSELLDYCSAQDLNHLYFITDLRSTTNRDQDETYLLQMMRDNAQRSIYTEVIGIGVDLSVDLVNRISAVRGCKYASGQSGEEFIAVVNNEFERDILPLAFDISLTLNRCQFILNQGFGAPDAAQVSSRPHHDVFIPSEFASAMNERGEVRGGVRLFKLARRQEPGLESNPDAESVGLELACSWTDRFGEVHKHRQTVQFPPDSADSANARASHTTSATTTTTTTTTTRRRTASKQHGASSKKKKISPKAMTRSVYSDMGIRKAIALKWYVDIVNEYATSENTGEEQCKGANASTPLKFAPFKEFFLEELHACQDRSHESTNQADIAILDKLIELESGAASTSAIATVCTGMVRQAKRFVRDVPSQVSRLGRAVMGSGARGKAHCTRAGLRPRKAVSYAA